MKFCDNFINKTEGQDFYTLTKKNVYIEWQIDGKKNKYNDLLYMSFSVSALTVVS